MALAHAGLPIVRSQSGAAPCRKRHTSRSKRSATVRPSTLCHPILVEIGVRCRNIRAASLTRGIGSLGDRTARPAVRPLLAAHALGLRAICRATAVGKADGDVDGRVLPGVDVQTYGDHATFRDAAAGPLAVETLRECHLAPVASPDDSPIH